MVLATGFEPAMGFLLWITKPVPSAIQPSQHSVIMRHTLIKVKYLFNKYCMRSHEIEPVRTLYHTSPRENRASIQSTGLEPRIQMFVNIKRRPGIYMFETLPQAREWAYWSAATDLQPHDIWEIKLPHSYRLVRDRHAEMDIYNAVIGYDNIAPQQVKLIKTQGVPRSLKNSPKRTPLVKSDITEMLFEGRSTPVIVVDVQPEYSGLMDGDENSVFPEIIDFVVKQTGPVLMFVNAEQDGLTSDTVDSIKQYWNDTVCPEEDRYTYDEENDEYIEKESCPAIDWSRFTIVDKGYGYFRDYMDSGVEPRLMIKLIRYMYQKRVDDARNIKFPPFNKRTSDETELYHLLEEYADSPFIINWTSVAQLKKFSGSYLVGGGRNECLREVEILMNAFNIHYRRIDHLVY